MFNSLDVRGLMARVKDFVWPRKGFIRAWKYLAVRLSRMNTTPHAIAAGFASGAAASFTRCWGCILFSLVRSLLSHVAR